MNYLTLFFPFLPLATHTVHFWSAGITLGSTGFCSDLEVKLIATLSALLELAHPTDVILSAASSAGCEPVCICKLLPLTKKRKLFVSVSDLKQEQSSTTYY